MLADRASLLACLFALSNLALAAPGEVSTSFNGSLATASASGEGRGGAICSGFNPDIFNGAILEKEIDAETWRAQLEQQLKAVPVASGRHSVVGGVSSVKADICWPYYGFDNLDKIKGTVSLSVAWKVDGVDIATTATYTQPKNGPGGLRGMLWAAYAENLRQLLGNPNLVSVLAKPEEIVAPVTEVASAPAPTPASGLTDARPVNNAIARPQPGPPIAASKLPVPLLQPGKLLRHTGKDAVSVFALEGGAGVTINVNAKLVGEGMLALYASDGSLMLDAEGSGALALEAVLSLDDMFYLAVGRSQASQPFTVKVDAIEPDIHLATFSNGVGYVAQAESKSGKPYDIRSCWIEPGLKWRRIFPNGYEDLSIGRSGKEFATWKNDSGAQGAGERQVMFKDDSVTYRWPDGSSADVVMNVEEIMDWDDEPRYFRYLCRAEDV